MSGLFVFIASPAQGSTVGRSMQLRGSVSGAGSGRLYGVDIQFGVGGPIVRASGLENWSWQGLIPNNIRPGQAFSIIVTSSGFIRISKPPRPGSKPIPDPEPTIMDVDGQAVLNVVLENVVPVLTVDRPFQSPIAVSKLPYLFELSGTATEGNGPPYDPPRVHYRIGSEPLVSVPVSEGRWRIASPLAPGDYPITIQATDAFASVTTVQTNLTVLHFPMPAEVDPRARKTLAGAPTTSSITSWTRLEPQSVNTDIATTTRARLLDPLWLMTRQWQVGEFQGEDAGSPVQARVRATNATLDRCHLGELAQTASTARKYDPMHTPLEALVERRRMRAVDERDPRMISLAVDAGLHFLRMLEASASTRKYGAAFRARYALQALPEQTTSDAATLRLVQTAAGRALDARRLAAAFRPTPAQQIVFDPALQVTAADNAALQKVAVAWLAWCDTLFTEPAGPVDDAWTPQRLEYAVSVSAQLSEQPQDALTLSASEFGGGRLDWYSFDINEKYTIDSAGEHTAAVICETTIPSPVSFRGMPAQRFWELEDAKVAYGLLSAGPTDLAHLMLIEYANSYGNDWYVVPLTVPVGSVTRVDSLVVTDTFGERNLLRPLGDPALPKPYFSMWQQAGMRYPGDSAGTAIPNRFFLPPTLGRSIDGSPLEDVLLMRDEMANLAWGIERSIEGGAETAVSAASGAAPASAAALPAGPAMPDTPPRYRLATEVPNNWIPLLPVQVDTGGSMRLKRGAVLQPDGSRRVYPAQGEVLNAAPGLLLYDEEVPREGVHVTRRRRMTRWIDGSTWVWTALRNEVGRGEGSAGLKFDQLEDESGKRH